MPLFVLSIYFNIVLSEIKKKLKTLSHLANAAGHYSSGLIGLWNDWHPPKTTKSKLLIDTILTRG